MATKTETKPAQKKLVVTLGVSKADGNAVYAKNVTFDTARTSRLFGKHLKVMVFVNQQTKKVEPVLYFDPNSHFGSDVIDSRQMSNGGPYCSTRLVFTPSGNPIEFVFSADEILTAIHQGPVCNVPVAAAPAAAPPKKAGKKKAEEEPEEEGDEEGEAEEGDEEEGDDAEGEEEGDDDAEGEEAEGDEEEGDDDEEGDEIDLANATREELIAAAKQLEVPFEKKWSDEKLRAACVKAHEASQEEEGEEGDEEEGEEAEGDEEEGEDAEGDEEGEEGDEEGEEGEEEGEEEEKPAPKKTTGKKTVKKKKKK